MELPPKDVAPGVASLPDATGPLGDGDNMRIVFERESSKLPPDARGALSTLAEQLRAQEGLRLQLLAYAGNADTSASAARRLSLSRALAVRSFLIESGVRSTRIDVRALGNKSSEDVTERVDITVMER
ncbi:OmpA family protein [Pseudomonadota bacterium]